MRRVVARTLIAATWAAFAVLAVAAAALLVAGAAWWFHEIGSDR